MINKKLGYYTVGQLEFSSKIQACLKSIETNQPLKWHFNEELFRSYNWWEEPVETLDELYNKRARQIREQYDYVMLSYSGGADSHNILMSFLRQGLFLDEIVVNTTEKASGKFTQIDPLNTSAQNAGAEHYLQTMPRLKEIAALIPKTKITIMDLSDCLFDSLEKTGDASWVLDKREGLNPVGMTRFNYLHFSDIQKRFDKGKKIAMVLGTEKPRTFVHDNRLYMRFVDRATNQNTVAEHMKEYPNSELVFFYWSPDCVPLLIKQGHTIKRWLRKNPQMLHAWDLETMSFEKVRLIHEPVLRSVVYTTWDKSWWQANKATLDWTSELDHWFIYGHQDSNAVAVWKEGIDYVKTHLSPFLKTSKDGEEDGLQIFSFNISIGKIDPNL